MPLQGVCLYPIVNHPGWDNDRHCHNGLWDYADTHGHREAFSPLADELCRQMALMDAFDAGETVPDDPIEYPALTNAARHMDEVAGVREE